eukprot:1645582-Prymnesium_polylepis.1
MRSVEDIEMPARLVDANGWNAHAMKCKFCGCAILAAGTATLAPGMAMVLPPMPRTRAAAPSTGSTESGEQVLGVWRVPDKYSFDNVGVSKSAGDAEAVSGESGSQTLRLLVCADCDLGPFGWFTDAADRGDKLGDGVDFFVATDRVRYVLG